MTQNIVTTASGDFGQISIEALKDTEGSPEVLNVQKKKTGKRKQNGEIHIKQNKPHQVDDWKRFAIITS